MDLALEFSGAADLPVAANADLAISSGMLATDDSLYTAVLISLFTDRRAGTDDELPAGETWRRGWWGDKVPPPGTPLGDAIGSRLWLLTRRKKTESTRLEAEEYAHAALNWLIADGHVRDVRVDAAWDSAVPGLLRLRVRLQPLTDAPVDVAGNTAASVAEYVAKSAPEAAEATTYNFALRTGE